MLEVVSLAQQKGFSASPLSPSENVRHSRDIYSFCKQDVSILYLRSNTGHKGQ